VIKEKEVGDKEVSELFSHFDGQIKCLSLHNSAISSIGITILKSQQLEELHLYDQKNLAKTTISSIGTLIILSALSLHSNLTDRVSLIFLCRLPQLKTLSLSVSLYCFHKHNALAIKRLKLNSLAIQDTNCNSETYLRAIGSMSSLKLLTLKNVGICQTSNSLQYLASLTQLSQLTLSENFILEKHLHTLMTLTKLIQLVIFDQKSTSGFHREEFKKLLLYLPKCEIFYTEGGLFFTKNVTIKKA